MRGRTRVLAALAVAAVVGVSCAQPAPNKPEAPDPAAVKADIEAANARFADAAKKGDKATMLANYTADAVVMMPGAPATQSTAALDSAFTAFLAQLTLKEATFTTTDVMLAGDLAVETGTFAFTLAPKKGNDISEKGKYLTVWKHQADGSWKIIRDINNSDLPPK
ncbi:MAG: YybH family protein [Gemmatimonadaceae bacterium]